MTAYRKAISMHHGQLRVRIKGAGVAIKMLNLAAHEGRNNQWAFHRCIIVHSARRALLRTGFLTPTTLRDI